MGIFKTPAIEISFEMSLSFSALSVMDTLALWAMEPWSRIVTHTSVATRWQLITIIRGTCPKFNHLSICSLSVVIALLAHDVSSDNNLFKTLYIGVYM